MFHINWGTFHHSWVDRIRRTCHVGQPLHRRISHCPAAKRKLFEAELHPINMAPWRFMGKALPKSKTLPASRVPICRYMDSMIQHVIGFKSQIVLVSQFLPKNIKNLEHQPVSVLPVSDPFKHGSGKWPFSNHPRQDLGTHLEGGLNKNTPLSWLERGTVITCCWMVST